MGLRATGEAGGGKLRSMQQVTEQQAKAADTRRDSLSVTDNRTGKTYEVPIEHQTVRATAFADMTLDKDGDHGLAVYDPSFMNTAACSSRITYIDGDEGILLYR